MYKSIARGKPCFISLSETTGLPNVPLSITRASEVSYNVCNHRMVAEGKPKATIALYRNPLSTRSWAPAKSRPIIAPGLVKTLLRFLQLLLLLGGCSVFPSSSPVGWTDAFSKDSFRIFGEIEEHCFFVKLDKQNWKRDMNRWKWRRNILDWW